ncbi:MAG: colanic acid biosynthesis glycosyltransferase WcaL [Leptolyngbya sp. DLM2.Bin15]|nr:MAG: colanic acid biosynthesis glycosyltransferase WcaL [Leptolyngbya sp. DLM2.Bin15]
MKIGYLIPEWPGQTHVWAWREICHLRELGLDVTIISTRRPPQITRGKHEFTDAAEAETVYLVPLRWYDVIQELAWAIAHCPGQLLACLRLGLTLPVYQKPNLRSVLPLLIPSLQLVRILRQHQIEHLHTPMPANSAILCMMAKQLAQVPYSLTLCAPVSHWGGAMREKILGAAFVTVVASWMLEQVQQICPDLPADRLSMTRHGVDPHKWVPVPQVSKQADAPTRLVSIGRLAPCKGFDVLLKAIAMVKQQGLALELHIAGEGNERPALEQLVRDLHLEKEVTLLGSVSEDQCLAEMQAADMFVLASHQEPLGVVYLEAMAVEVATVGTRAGGVVDMIVDGETGLLVPPGDVEALSGAIARLIQNPGLRDRLGKAGRQAVLSHFDSRIGATKLRDLMVHSTYDLQNLEESALSSSCPV